MSTTTLNKALIITAIGLTAGTSQAANIILNGSFENTGTAITPDTVGAAWGDTAAAADLTDWTITQNNTLGLSNGGASGPHFSGNGSSVPFTYPTDGDTYLGTSGDGTSILTQSISGVGTGNLTVSFDWAALIANGNSGTASITLDIFQGSDSSGSSIFSGSVTSTDDVQDTWHSASFTPVFNNSTDIFVQLTIEDNMSAGQMAIDNLSIDVAAVPEPSSTALIGLVGIGFIFRRNRKA
ncbi:PEP-CTERM protein-sorting domain-containing protein [Rubritalea squalenifaciens DSM 18772]|uniref:PEP-CTERM protein-sorting domain-containing protein n=2 Tax=Rubritalea TaxID=361050 RepID=A0A1M6N8Z8_9BACT|nr:PEP-CTERM sorting domain-containing protein [Rubritalea squalenifaciens]SHJ92141.1 PEP-CTERM protein-sorting domain-containing protein [Rubritalea squalenifaciens DSM 18772]